jgi:hypothetical protein
MKENPGEVVVRRSRKKRVFYGYRSQNLKERGGRAAASLVLVFASLVFLLAFLFLLWNPLTPRDIANWLASPPEMHEQQAVGHQGSAQRVRAPRSPRTAVSDFSLLRADGGVFELSALRRFDREMLGIQSPAVFHEFSALGSAFADERLVGANAPAEDFRSAFWTPELRTTSEHFSGALSPALFEFGPSSGKVPGFSGGPTGGGFGPPMGFNPGRPGGENPEGGVDNPSSEEPAPPSASGEPPSGAPVVAVPEAAAWMYLAWGSLCLAALAFFRRP